jgi:hypothetical protein
MRNNNLINKQMDYLVEEKKNEDNSFGFGFIIGAAAVVGAVIYGFCVANKTTTQVIERASSSSYNVLNFVYDGPDLYKRDFYRRRDEARRRMEREKWFVTSSDIRRFHTRWRKKFYEEGHIGTYHY